MGSRMSRQEVTTSHFFFGQVAVRNQFNKELIVAFKSLLRQDEYEQWERGYRQIKQVNKQSLFLPQSFQKQHIKKYFACCQCTADYEMSLVYERFDNLYKDQLTKRQSGNNKMYYKEEELFLILYQLTIGIKQFQVQGYHFGDIRPSQMIITSSTKHIKMINIYSFPKQTSAVDKILDGYNKQTKFYLSPEEISYVNSSSRNSNIPNPKTQAFSLGLSILQAAILQNSQDLYTLNPRSINMKLLGQRLKILQQKYPLLKVYISKLLTQKPQERFSCGEIWAILKNYSQKITLMQKFNRHEIEQVKNLQNFRKNGK